MDITFNTVMKNALEESNSSKITSRSKQTRSVNSAGTTNRTITILGIYAIDGKKKRKTANLQQLIDSNEFSMINFTFFYFFIIFFCSLYE